MSSITVSSLVLGSLTVQVDGADSTLALSVLGTAPASLSIELGTPGAQGDAATIAVGTTTTLSPGSSATVANVGTSSAAVFNFGIPAGQTGATGATGSQGPAGTAATATAGTTTTGAPGSSASVTNVGTTSAAIFDFTIPRGDTGLTGATGATGATGPGVASGGTTGQFLQKASGTNYDTSWATIVPGDRYLTSSTSSLTVSNGSKSLTVGTGLSYTTTQNVTIAYNNSNHMHGEVLTYDSGTGAMTVDVNHHTGSGTYTAWVVNVGGVTPATSVAWGEVTGTLSNQTDLQAALDAKLSTSTAASTYQTQAGMSSYLTTATASTTYYLQTNPAGYITSSALTGYATQSWVTSQGYLTSAPVTSVAGKTGAVTLAVADVSGALATANNLSELTATASTARTNLGLGTAATASSSQLIPSGGTTGQVLSKIDGTNYNVQWSTASGGGGGIDVQTFGSSTTSGTFTWTKPANAKIVEVWLWGGGGGGASGGRYATTSARSGGGGAAGGSFCHEFINAAYLGSTVTVTIGAGGAGAAAQTTNNTAGINGNNGNISSFSIYRAAYGGFGWGGSTTGGTNGGSVSAYNYFTTISAGAGGLGQPGAGLASNNQTGHCLIPNGGGGGAGQIANSAASSNGGIGGGFALASLGSGITAAVAGGSAGQGNGTLPGNGTSATTQYFCAGTGGGGAAYITNVAGMAGANGGWPGGGGGGGAASDNGFNSGAGGNGANGYAIIITYT